MWPKATNILEEVYYYYYYYYYYIYISQNLEERAWDHLKYVTNQRRRKVPKSGGGGGGGTQTRNLCTFGKEPI